MAVGYEEDLEAKVFSTDCSHSTTKAWNLTLCGTDDRVPWLDGCQTIVDARCERRSEQQRKDT